MLDLGDGCIRTAGASCNDVSQATPGIKVGLPCRHVLVRVAKTHRRIPRNRRHGRLPRFPRLHHLRQPCGLQRRQVRPLALVLRQVEQVIHAIHPQVFPVAVPHGALAAVVHAPEQGAVGGPGRVVQQGGQGPAVPRIVGVRLRAAQVQHGGAPVHGQAGLGAGAAGGDGGGPVGDPGHADAAFGQVHLAADQGPVVGEAFAAVVAGEYDEGVALQAVGAQRVHDAADALVHVVDHAAVGFHVAAGQVVDGLLAVAQFVGQGLVVAGFPGPVGGGVVDAQEERRARPGACGHARDVVHRVVGDEVGQVALLGFFLFAEPEVVRAVGAAVGEVVHSTGHRAEEFLVARFQRAEVRRVAQVPFAHEGGAVAGVLQQRGQRGVGGRQAQAVVAAGGGADGFLGRAAQAVLVARRHEREARGRAHGRVGVALGELQSAGGQAVQHGRNGAEGGIAAAVAPQVGIAQVIGHDEEDVRSLRRLFLLRHGVVSFGGAAQGR